MINKYIKKPISVEAVQWGGSCYTKDRHNWIFDSGNVRFDEFDPGVLIVSTLEGEIKARLGDYIVKGITDCADWFINFLIGSICTEKTRRNKHEEFRLDI